MKAFCEQHGKKIAAVVVWLLIWQLVTQLVDNSILLAGPWETLLALVERMRQGSLWLTVGCSLQRIGSGFMAGLVLGLLLAAIASRFPLLEELLRPFMALLKAIPVASFVVLFLIWWRSNVLAVAVSFCIVLPNFYVHTLEGIRNVDGKLLEMAQVLKIPAWNRFFYLYRPALKPYLDSAVRISVGMSWKSGVAAEVIGTPALSVGEQLYLSKIYLDTAGVLAWTAVTVLASMLCEKAVLALWQWFQRWEPRCRAARSSLQRRDGTADTGSEVLRLRQISKSYGGVPVLQGVTASYEKGNCYYFRTPSGSGKTTLFRLIAGLEEPDTGDLVWRCGSRVSMVFQEDRLCEAYSALVNVDMVTGNRARSREHLLCLLEETDLDKPCRELSGGMKRRVAIARAMAAGGEVILLDEPYTGLDHESRSRAEHYIHSRGAESALLIATHIGEEETAKQTAVQ